MKKEIIYELIEKSFMEKNKYKIYLNTFINKLKDEGYFEMANIISEIKNKNSKIKFAKQNKKYDFKIFGEKIKKEAELINLGYKNNIIKSVFLYGKTGTGKTTFAEILSKSLKIDIVELRLSSIFDSRYGETIKKFETFITSNINKRQIIFIDEAESLFKKRGSSNDVFESDRLLTTMLKLMDKDREALIILASNLKNNIDKAILRRFDILLNFDNVEINLSKELENKIKKYGIEITNQEMIKILKIVNETIKKPKFSEMNFIARRIALEKLSNHSITKICKNLKKILNLKSIESQENE